MAHSSILRVNLRVATRLDLSLVVPAGITAITGASGAGKTTLLCAIAGLVRPSAGEILLNDTPLYNEDRAIFIPPHQRRIALLMQSVALFPHLRVWQNVAFGITDVPRSARKRLALEWLERTRVASLAERMPSSISGGEAQRVALARALACQPRALLLDEPFSALDLELRRDLSEHVRQLVDELGLPTVLVTHDIDDAHRLSTQHVVLVAGRILEQVPQDTPTRKDSRFN